MFSLKFLSLLFLVAFISGACECKLIASVSFDLHLLLIRSYSLNPFPLLIILHPEYFKNMDFLNSNVIILIGLLFLKSIFFFCI